MGANRTLNMRIIAAYMLAVLGGVIEPTQEQIKKIIAAVGLEVDQAGLETAMKSLQGKSFKVLIEQGASLYVSPAKVASLNAGGAAPAAGAAGAAPAADEKKEESEEEEDMDLGGLF